ncbi:LysR substrate-binding domain-containing protein [Oceanimonas doudoroffii]|uniref:HTH lysR-type domain-containing protein n=2 Tax=Oceanimonas TaxID=129577 RepID=A0A233RDH5_9GAMM|nr:LysR substrate-binding domain-containing protein [Oceanimonas doudoroffii]OXY81430.1 hypothetical protein B6S08_13180 [Oceanimonas doudoroffii]
MVRPSLSSLKAFDAIVSTGSLRAAAQALSITQSAVSHQLRRLEDSLGVALVARSGRGVVPTAEGRRLAEGLREGFRLLDQAVDGLLSKEQGQRLRVRCLPSVAVRWLIPRLSGFRERYPELSISIQYADYLYAPIDAEADVLINWLDGEPPAQAEGQRLFSGATYPVASPLYLDRVGEARQPVDLLHWELLHDHSHQPWQQWFRHHGLNPATLSDGGIYQEFNLLSAAAITGQGVALCPLRLIEDELLQGTLLTLFDQPVNEQRAYWLFHHPQPSTAVQVFCDWIREQAANGAVQGGDPGLSPRPSR